MVGVVVVVDVVVGVVDVVVVGAGAVVLHAIDNAPITTAVANPNTAEYRRELCFTNVIHTHARLEIRYARGAGKRTACCQPRAGTLLTPSVGAEGAGL